MLSPLQCHWSTGQALPGLPSSPCCPPPSTPSFTSTSRQSLRTRRQLSVAPREEVPNLAQLSVTALTSEGNSPRFYTPPLTAPNPPRRHLNRAFRVATMGGPGPAERLAPPKPGNSPRGGSTDRLPDSGYGTKLAPVQLREGSTYATNGPRHFVK